MRKIILFSISILLAGWTCTTNQKEKNGEKPPLVSNISDSGNPTDEVIIPSDSGVVKINLKEGKGIVSIRKKAGQTIYIEFESEGYKKVLAYLSSTDSLANIRFSQIFLPDGTMDGPFGKNMEYVLSQNGLYKMSVHENMMAGDPWTGIFSVQLELIK